MSNRNPAEYVVAGVLNALHSISPSKSISHSLSPKSVRAAFLAYCGVELDNETISYVLRWMENAGVLTVIVDPYADTLLETSDSKISSFVNSSENEVIQRGWGNEDWLKTALGNSNLWVDMESIVAGAESVVSVPSADGFVTINHNSTEYVEAEAAVVAADEALRGDNTFEDNEQKTWIKTHVETGLDLIKRGGPVLRSALIALIVEPLKAAIKATANENVKKLIGIALAAFLKWLS